MKRIIAIALLVIGTILGAVGPSFAQGNKFPIALTCGGTTYQVTKTGNGDWAPVRDDNSTLVFHPTAFGEQTRTFTPSDGSPPQTDTRSAGEFQAQPQNGHPTDDCTYHVEHSDPSGTEVVDGSVTVYTTGTRNNG
jgi:hypothetical protein